MTKTDIEQHRVAGSHFLNSTIHNISWRDLTVTTKGYNNEGTKAIISNVEGVVEAGPFCSPMLTIYTLTSSKANVVQSWDHRVLERRHF